MEMRTEEMLCAGLHAGPVQVLKHQNRKGSINKAGSAQQQPSLQISKIRKLRKHIYTLQKCDRRSNSCYRKTKCCTLRKFPSGRQFILSVK